MFHNWMNRYGPEFGKDVTGIPDTTVEKLIEYDWPGNVRELESVVKQSLLRSRGSMLLPQFLPPLLGVNQAEAARQGDDFQVSQFVASRLAKGSTDLYAETISSAERRLLCQVLAYTKGNQLQASGILGISRVTLRSKIRSLGININEFTK